MRSLALSLSLGVLFSLLNLLSTPIHAQMKWESLQAQEGFYVYSFITHGSDFWLMTGNSLYRSEAGIDNWESSENGLFTGKRPTNLKIIKGKDKYLYAYLPYEEKNFFIWSKNDKKWVYFVSLPKYLSDLSVASSGDVYYSQGTFSGFVKRINSKTGDVEEVANIEEFGLNGSYAISEYKILNDTSTLVVCKDFQNTIGFIKTENKPARKIMGSWKPLKFMATDYSGLIFALHKDTLFQYDRVKEQLIITSIESNAKNAFSDDYINVAEAENEDLWVGSRDNLYKSIDKGNTWEEWSNSKHFQGKEIPNFYEVVIANNRPYCSTPNCSPGIYSIENDPGTTTFYKPKFKESYYNFVNGDLNGNVYTSYCGTEGIQVSSDNAQNWRPLKRNGAPVALYPDFTSTGHVIFFPTFKDSCYITNDGGNTWDVVKFPNIKFNVHTPVYLNTTNGLLVVVSDRELFYSKDFGKTWQEQTGASLLTGTFMSVLNYDFVQYGIVMKSEYNLFRIFNLKENEITEVKHNWGTMAEVFTASDSEMWLFDRYEKDSMYILKPDGKMVASKKLSNITASDLELNFFKAVNGDIYALIDNIVYYSQNNGDSWKQITAESDLEDYANLVSLWTNGKGTLFTHDLYSDRIYKTQRVVVSTESANHQLPIHIFPNPAQTSVTIDLNKSGLESATCILYDLAGKALKTIVAPQSSLVSFPLETVLPGMYFLQVSDANGRVVYHTKLSVVD